MRECPEARNAEREMLIQLAYLSKGAHVLDIQAAGGYLSDGIYDALAGQVDITCLEPCEQLSQRLSPCYRHIADPVERWLSVADQSLDSVLGLAGLHHSEDQLATVTEAFRTLKAGGRVSICDVIEGSDIAKWLNEFVDKHNPAGHKGDFLEPGELSSLYRCAGFEKITEDVCFVPWRFPSEQIAARFFVGLFGLSCDEETALCAMKEYLKIRTFPGGCEIAWELIYGTAVKPIGDHLS